MTSDMKGYFLSALEGLSEKGFSIGVGFCNSQPAWVHVSYPQNWIDHYVNKRFLIDDPTILHGQSHTGHITWSELEKLYPESPVFGACRRFGLMEGNTLAMRIEDVCTIASCSGSAWNANQLRHAEAAVSGLHHLMKHQLMNSKPSNDILTTRERQVLELMAGGMLDQEIADVLLIKIETVRARRQSARQKTGTRSIASLMSFVIRSGWL